MPIQQFFSYIYKNPIRRVGLIQFFSGPHHNLIENSRHDIAEKLLNWR
jgi:hypothetical protein